VDAAGKGRRGWSLPANGGANLPAVNSGAYLTPGTKHMTSAPDEADLPRHQMPWDEGVAVPLPPEAGFTPQEHWAWARIIRGERADMRFFPKDNAAAQATGDDGPDDGAGGDPRDAGKWPEHRDLSAQFIYTILFCEPWSSACARSFVRIGCARFREELDWENETFDGEIELSGSLFEEDVIWRGLTVGKLFDLQRSCIEGVLRGDGLTVKGALFCRGGFHAKDDVRLLGARIGRDLSFTDARIEGALRADRLSIEGSLFCGQGFTIDGDIRLLGARFGGNADFEGARFEGALRADGCLVEGTCFLRNMKKLGATDLLGARILQNMHLSGSHIVGLIDLTGIEIQGELNLAQFVGNAPTWADEARLVLRNAKAGALACGLHAFRRGKSFVACDLAGFSYERIGGIGAGGAGSTLASAKGEDLRIWLQCCRPSDHFDPAPYRALASALEAAGRKDRAADVRNALGNYELVAKGTPLLQRVMLALSWLFIGYGERNHRAFIAFALLVLGAAGVGYWHELVWPSAATIAGWTDRQAWLDWGGFAFADAVPLITFDEAHKTFLADRFCGAEAKGVCDRTPAGLTAFYYFVKVAGFAILSYLAAGLSGLAQRGD
jgi:hypothetical protein